MQNRKTEKKNEESLNNLNLIVVLNREATKRHTFMRFHQSNLIRDLVVDDKIYLIS